MSIGKKTIALAGALLALTLALTPACSRPSGAGEDFPGLDAPGLKNLLARSKAGGQAVLICFWATNCPACRLELVELERLREANGQGLLIIAVAIERDRQALETFFASRMPNYPVYLAQNGVYEDYEVSAIPTLVLYDKAGVLRFNRSGAYPFAMLEGMARQAVGG
ncbi:MAG: TlpA disulfide reductase family protein [Desulfovibrionaceae bacterium]|nr:TlpA disulfide reductase family protein [Desulfovibrionaceae bacterium]